MGGCISRPTQPEPSSQGRVEPSNPTQIEITQAEDRLRSEEIQLNKMQAEDAKEVAKKEAEDNNRTLKDQFKAQIDELRSEFEANQDRMLLQVRQEAENRIKDLYDQLRAEKQARAEAEERTQVLVQSFEAEQSKHKKEIEGLTAQQAGRDLDIASIQELQSEDYAILVWYNSLLIRCGHDLSQLSEMRQELLAREQMYLESLSPRDLKSCLATLNPEEPGELIKLCVIGALHYNWKRITPALVDRMASNPARQETLIANATRISDRETELSLRYAKIPPEKRILIHTILLYFYFRPDSMYQYEIKDYFSNPTPVNKIESGFWEYFDAVVNSDPVRSAFDKLNKASGEPVIWDEVFQHVKTHTFFDDLPGLHGLSCVGSNVFINIKHIRYFDRVLIVLLHEIAHLGKRMGKKELYGKTSQMHSSMTKDSRGLEDGVFLEVALFGSKVKKLYSGTETFLMDPLNWNQSGEEFLAKFDERQKNGKSAKEESVSMSRIEGDESSGLVCGVSGT